MISNKKAMKRSIFKQVILLAGLFTLSIGFVQAQDLNTAIQLTRSEQYDKSEEVLQALIQKEPSNAKNYFYLGENFLLDYIADTISNSLAIATKSAHDIFQKGVAANPNEPLNYVGLAKVTAASRVAAVRGDRPANGAHQRRGADVVASRRESAARAA
jgi:hypothetical protein